MQSVMEPPSAVTTVIQRRKKKDWGVFFCFVFVFIFLLLSLPKPLPVVKLFNVDNLLDSFFFLLLLVISLKPLDLLSCCIF